MIICFYLEALKTFKMIFFYKKKKKSTNELRVKSKYENN